jgi:hypothetical protein
VGISDAGAAMKTVAQMRNAAHSYIGIWCGMAINATGPLCVRDSSINHLCALADGTRMLADAQELFSAQTDEDYQSRIEAARQFALADQWPTADTCAEPTAEGA